MMVELGIDGGGRRSRPLPLEPGQPSRGRGPRRRWDAAGAPIVGEEGPTRTNSGGYGVDGSGCTVIVIVNVAVQFYVAAGAPQPNQAM